MATLLGGYQVGASRNQLKLIRSGHVVAQQIRQHKRNAFLKSLYGRRFRSQADLIPSDCHPDFRLIVPMSIYDDLHQRTPYRVHLSCDFRK